MKKHTLEGSRVYTKRPEWIESWRQAKRSIQGIVGCDAPVHLPLESGWQGEAMPDPLSSQGGRGPLQLLKPVGASGLCQCASCNSQPGLS